MQRLPDHAPAAVMTGVDTTAITLRPVPAPGTDEVLVEIRAVGICGSDVHWYRHGHIGDTWVTDPLVLGHEAAGVIVAVGAGVDPSRIGQRVALEPGIPCRRCRECRAGRYNLCPDVRFYATPPVDGVLSQYATTAADFAHPVPDTMSDDEAALLEPLSVGIWACRRAAVSAGDRVLVTGAGPIGLVALQVAIAFGASSVTVTDISADRLAVARQLGATVVLDAGAGNPPELSADVLLECSGAPSAVDTGIRALDRAGRAVLVGMSPTSKVPVPTDVVQGRELTLTGTFRYANTYPTAIDLVTNGRVDLARLVTSHHSLDQVHDALLAATVDPHAIKAVVLPHSPTFEALQGLSR